MANVAATLQGDRSVDLIIAEQAAKGTLAAANSGVRLPFNSHNGIVQNQTRIADPQNRKNGMTGASKLGRTGYNLTGAQHPLLVGVYDLLLQGMQRNPYVAAATKTQASSNFDTIDTVATNGVVTFNSSADLVTEASVKVGQYHVYTVGLAAADLNIPHLVLAVTATTITYASTFTEVTTGTTDFSFSYKKHALNGTQRWPFTIEDQSEIRDFSEIGDFAILSGVTLSGSGQAPLSLSFDFLIADFTTKSGGDSPHFTTIAAPATTNFITTPETVLRLNGVDVPYDSFSFQWNLNAFVDNTNKSTAIDVGYGSTAISGSFTVLDDANAQTAFAASLADTYNTLAIEGSDDAAQFIAAFFPRVKLINPTKSQNGQDQFSTRTFGVEIEEDIRGGVFPNTMAVISTD